jgi:uncharacterized integral membrane protein
VADEVEVQPVEKEKGLNARLVLGLLAAVALALFVVQNTDDAEVKFLWMDGSIPVYLLLLVTVILTLIVTLVVVWVRRRR